jgi:fructose-1,6-bisphosphatase/inositol monophosphatase family enzyme
VLGVVDQPITRERWIGAAGQPTTLGGAPARVRPCPSLSRARLSSSGPQYFDPAGRAAFDRVSTRASFTSWGGDGYAYALVASGCIDLVIESGLKLHDWAAIAPVVEGAGGVVTDWKGRPLDAGSAGDVVAAGDARCHAEALELLAG